MFSLFKYTTTKSPIFTPDYEAPSTQLLHLRSKQAKIQGKDDRQRNCYL